MDAKVRAGILLAACALLPSAGGTEPGHEKKAPRVITNALGMKLARIPAGKFLMGASRDDDLARADEKPRHAVRISRPFYLGVHEVTVGQFKAFVRKTGFRTAAETDGKGTSGYDARKRGFEYDSPKYSWRNTGYAQSDRHPVVNVNWHDARAFCRWLSKKEGHTYRLPAEAEWEYACRAGTTARFTAGEAVKDLKPLANLGDRTLAGKWDTETVKRYGLDPKKITFVPWEDGFAFTAPVGRFRPNAFGLYDMLGNAGEFCRDGYAADYYKDSPKVDPAGPGKKRTGHVVRGGTFLNGPTLVRTSSRVECPDAYRNYVIGFRVVLEADDFPPKKGSP
jgi:sulfatase modifying factor 1